ncbi:hypothetical protein QCN27_19695 [Cereibacter sp. SYSU M97828]|nr:hypothetical protein [Cereibacter flavus]
MNDEIIEITEAQAQALVEEAGRQGISVNELVCRLLDDGLSRSRVQVEQGQ